MKKRPLSILIISMSYLLIAPLGLGYLWYRAGFDAQILTTHLSWDVLGVLVCGSVVGFGVFKVRPWGYFAFLGYSAALILAFVYRHLVDPTNFNYFSVVFLVGALGVVAGMIQKHFSAPYFNPQMRWWESDPRLKAQMEAQLKIDGVPTDCTVLDISHSGVFVSSDAKLSPGDVIKFSLTLIDYDIELMARVVRMSDSLGGYGLMFIDSSRNSQKVIKSVIRYLAGQQQKSSSEPQTSIA